MWVESDDTRLFVEEGGRESGEPVLFLAGLGYGSWCWREIMRLLCRGRRAYRLLAVDNRGAGRSEKPAAGYSVDTFAKDALAVLDAAGVSSAHVVGNSMGGYIAMSLARRSPERVRSLLLSNTTYGGEGTVPMPAASRDVWREAAALPPRRFAHETMATAFPPGWAEANADRFASLLALHLEHPTPLSCWKAHLDACLRFLAQGIDASEIEQPVLVVHGTEDRILPYGNGPRLLSALSRAELRTLEGAGHMPFLEDPEGFAGIARAWLDAYD